MLKFGDRTLNMNTKMGDVDMFSDGIIALKAEVFLLSHRDTTSLAREHPDMQVPPTSGVAHVSNEALTSATQPLFRQALQEVNRQLTVPPHQSMDDATEKKTSNSSPDTRSDGQLDSAFLTSPSQARTPQMIPSATQSPPIAQNPKPEPGGSQASAEPPASQHYEPRMEADPFVGPLEETDQTVRGEPLRQLAQHEDPDRLEAAVRTGIDLLVKLQQPLEQLMTNADAQIWLKQIENVRQDAVKSRTVVGVVGNTGAGKSSVINALLDEERLVPTNCMRACTAVVTELSYNYSDLEDARYRAEMRPA